MEFLQTANNVEVLLNGRSLDGWEIFHTASRKRSVEVKEQKVDTFTCSQSAGVSIRVLKSGRMGFSFSTSLESADLARMIDNAVIGAENQTPDPFLGIPLSEEYPVVHGMFDELIAAVPEEEKVRRAADLERLTLAQEPRIKKVRKASYSESIYQVAIRNSLG